MLKDSGRREKNGEADSGTKDSLENDVDALFKLPLPEFTGARNALAARLKKDGRGNDANLVKALTKPPISAWAVNQLYWQHRDAFDRLIATGQRFLQAQKSRTAGKIADMRGSLDARRESLSQLTDLATALLQDAGHTPTPDTMLRITATLEAMSAYASLSDGPTPGRLTHDVDPPGFESLASLMSGSITTKTNEEPTRVAPSQKSGGAAAQSRQKVSPSADVQRVREIEETRQTRIAAARFSLQDAKRSLTEARTRAQQLETSQKKAQTEAKKADAEAKQAERQLRDAEEHFKKARTASEGAAQTLQSITAEVREASKAVENAKRSVEKATKELESLLRESPGK